MEAYVGSLLVTPLLGVLLLPWISKLGRRSTDVFAGLVGLATLVSALGLVPSANTPVFFDRLGVHLSSDGLSLLFVVVINLVSFLCLVYSWDYIAHHGGRAKFYALVLLLIFGLNGVALVRDLFSLYVFLEVASVASYVLVAFNLEFDGIEASLKYLLLSVVATGLILIGLSLVFAATGTLTFAGIKAALLAFSAPPALFLFAAALFIVGFGLKAAVMPFHAWLPDAHPSAPAPISAMLSGVVIKVAGIYCLARMLFDLYPAPPSALKILLALGVVSMAVGAMIAYQQTDLKRMLAYSSVSQIGYILIGLGLGNALGIAGALFHVLNHALFKSLLFLNSGAVQLRTGTRDITKMGGLESRMRVTGITSVFGTLSIAGIPPFNGFWSKLFIILGAVVARNYVVAFLLVAFSIFTLGYFLLLQRRVFFGRLDQRFKDLREAPASMSAAVVILAAQCLLVGVFFPDVMRYLIEPAMRVLIGGH
jgi:multicomponent Na+:H+ antiporter subunit D